MLSSSVSSSTSSISSISSVTGHTLHHVKMEASTESTDPLLDTFSTPLLSPLEIKTEKLQTHHNFHQHSTNTYHPSETQHNHQHAYHEYVNGASPSLSSAVIQQCNSASSLNNNDIHHNSKYNSENNNSYLRHGDSNTFNRSNTNEGSNAVDLHQMNSYDNNVSNSNTSNVCYSGYTWQGIQVTTILFKKNSFHVIRLIKNNYNSENTK